MPSYGTINESSTQEWNHDEGIELQDCCQKKEVINKTEDLHLRERGLIRNRNDFFILIACAMINYVGFCAFSIIAPFYPSEVSQIYHSTYSYD